MKSIYITKKKLLIGVLSGFLFVSTAYAQQSQTARDNSSQLKTLDKIKQQGSIKIGYMANIYPISYQVNNRLIGYGVDICMEIVQKIKEKNNQEDLRIEYVPINYGNLIPNMNNGSIDIECGSFVNNELTRKYLDFTIPYYISGAKIMTNDKTITSLESLKNKKVMTINNTASSNILINENNSKMSNISIQNVNDESALINALINKSTDAFVANDLILYRINGNADIKKTTIVINDLLNVEPISPVFRKNDPAFKSLIDETMIDLANNGKLRSYYRKWFETQIPPRNENLNSPPSFLLKDVLRMPTDVVGN